MTRTDRLALAHLRTGLAHPDDRALEATVLALIRFMVDRPGAIVELRDAAAPVVALVARWDERGFERPLEHALHLLELLVASGARLDPAHGDRLALLAANGRSGRNAATFAQRILTLACTPLRLAG